MRCTLPILISAVIFSGAVTQPSPDAPAARGGHAMAYDSEHQLTLMFGGGNRQQSFSDLWAWNGDRWRKLAESGPSRATPQVRVRLESTASDCHRGPNWKRPERRHLGVGRHDVA